MPPELRAEGAGTIAMNELQTQPSDAALEAIRRLCRAIIHDINNPLGAVSGYLQLSRMRLDKLRSGDLSVTESLVDYHEKTQGALDRIIALVQRLDRFSKVKLEPPCKIALCELWSALIAARSPEEQSRIQLTCPESLTIRTLRSCLEQISFELLDNALWATRPGGAVEVEVSPAGSDRIAIEVRDTGPGMEAERLEKAHLPCYITREGKGFPKEGLLLGLGLPIVYQLTAALGGKFTLSSAPGEGCRARVELPAAWVK